MTENYEIGPWGGGVLAIDPGHEQSAWVAFDGARVLGHGIEPNETLRRALRGWAAMQGQPPRAVVLEQIESFGMAVGREVFETVFWTGRLLEAATALQTGCIERMPRKVVKSHLCHSTRANDSNIRVALIDRFGGTEHAIGKKRTPGPLYGIKSHEWAALAIAVTWWDRRVHGSEAHA